MCYFIVSMSSLLSYNVENSKNKENPSIQYQSKVWTHLLILGFSLFLLLLVLIYYIPKENNVLFTPYIFSDTLKYLLHFWMLSRTGKWSNSRTYQESNPTFSGLANSLNTNEAFVNYILYVWVLEYAPGYP
jgi:hypothetical protein